MSSSSPGTAASRMMTSGPARLRMAGRALVLLLGVALALTTLAGCSFIGQKPTRGRVNTGGTEKLRIPPTLVGTWGARTGATVELNSTAGGGYPALEITSDGQMTRGELQADSYVSKELLGTIKMLDADSFTVGDESNITHFTIDGDVLTLTNSDGTNGFNRLSQAYFDGWKLDYQGQEHFAEMERLLTELGPDKGSGGDPSGLLAKAKVEFDAAAADYKAAIAADPTNRDPVFRLTHLYAVVGGPYFSPSYTDEAIRVGSRWVDKKPDEGADVRWALAMAYNAKGDTARAIALLKESLLLDQNYQPSLDLLSDLEG